ncbi:MAG: hypothetical protein KC766_18495 [Myxococcales bacterium]|nr:hypothetical protein [Myxococcales bacterium]
MTPLKSSMSFSGRAGLITLALIGIPGCGQLIGLGDFHEAESGGAGGSGATGGQGGAGGTGAAGGVAGSGGSAGGAGTGGDAGTGGVGGSSGMAGTGGTAGTGGSPTTFNCVNQGTPKRIFSPAELTGFDHVLLKLATDQGSDQIHVLAALSNSTATRKVLVKTFTETGQVIDSRSLDLTEAFFPEEAVVTGDTIHFQGHDGSLVSLDADKSDTSLVRTVLDDPCPGNIHESAFYFDKTNQHFAGQCRTGEVFVDGASTALFTSSYDLRSMVTIGASQFYSLSDETTLVGELRYSPSFDSQQIDYGVQGPSLNFLYPSTTTGQIAMMSLDMDASFTDGRFRWGTFDPASPPTTASPPNLPVIATIANGYFEPGHGGSEFGRLTMGSNTQDKRGVHISQLGLDGSVRVWNHEVIQLATGIAVEVDAGEMGALSSAVAWVAEQDDGSGGTERSVDLQVVSCSKAGG